MIAVGCAKRTISGHIDKPRQRVSRTFRSGWCISRTPQVSPGINQRREAGFTLLEVILSLAILTGAIAVLGELARVGISNADYTHKLTKAQLLCEGKMAEITSGITFSDPVSGVSFESEMNEDTASMIDPDEIPWLYSIASDLIDDNGLLEVTVTVYQDLPEEKRPVTCSLVRWMMDSSLTGTEDDFLGDSSSGSF
jgi:prepilin-type N-terminal cleavage/methylation domain-containing protein